MTAEAPARLSVRASLLACSAVSLLALWIAAFEMPMTDFPVSPVLPLTALGFLACCLWSAFQLTRIRQHGVRFAAPLIVCALTLAALVWVPFTQIWLQGNFLLYRADRERIVVRVESGELVPNVARDRNLIALGNSGPKVSTGNDIVIKKPATAPMCCF